MGIGMTRVQHVKVPVFDWGCSVAWYAELLDLVPFRVTTTFRRLDDDWKVIHWHGDASASGQNGAIAQQQLSAPCGTLASDSANSAAGTERGRG